MIQGRGVDQNFQRDLGAIGPYELHGKFVWTNGPFALLSGKFVWTNGDESSSKVSPETGIGPWIALPSDYTNRSEMILLCNRCECNWKFIFRELLCVIGAFTESTLWRQPNYTKRLLSANPI